MKTLVLTDKELNVLAYVVGDEEVKQFVNGKVPEDDFGFFEVLRNIEKKIEKAKRK